jgi:hypothetical protein
MRALLRIAALASVFVLSHAGHALADSPLPVAPIQRTGFAIDRFEPAERGSRFFVVDPLDFRGPWRPAAGAVLDYGYKPLVAYDNNGDERGVIIRHQMWLHLGGSIVLWERLRLGLNLPLALDQDGDTTRVNGQEYKPADKSAIGDVRLAADLRLIGQKTDAFTLALGVRAWLPTGPKEQFAGDGSVRVSPQLLAAGELGILSYAARFALIARGHDDTFGDTELGSELAGSFGLGVRALNGRLTVGPEIYASSVFTGTDTFLKTRTSPFEGLLGAHYEPARDVRIGAGVGTGFTTGYGSPQFRGLLSFEWTPFDRPDRDHDEIPDSEDACPEAAGQRDPDPKKNGCPPPPPPPPPADTDGDGVSDPEDACPSIPGPYRTNPKTSGCPDRDQDGVADPNDACPDLPGQPTNDPKTNGCPPDAIPPTPPVAPVPPP